MDREAPWRSEMESDSRAVAKGGRGHFITLPVCGEVDTVVVRIGAKSNKALADPIIQAKTRVCPRQFKPGNHWIKAETGLGVHRREKQPSTRGFSEIIRGRFTQPRFGSN